MMCPPLLAHCRSSVTLVERGYTLLASSSDHNRAVAMKRLVEEGVEVMLGMDVESVGADVVAVRQRAAPGGAAHAPKQIVVASDLTVWTAGEGRPRGSEARRGRGAGTGLLRVVVGRLTGVGCRAVPCHAGASLSPVVGAVGLAKDERGRILLDSFLRSVEDPNVYVVGDNAAVQGT
jgi:NADH dehydrogenase FAD-containing subunit